MNSRSSFTTFLNQEIQQLVLQLQQSNQQNQTKDEQIKQLRQQTKLQDEQIKLLLQQNQEKDKKLETPFDDLLLRFSRQGDTKKAQAAITMGANLEVIDEEGLTPLQLSILNGHEELALVLLDKGAQIDAVNNQGKTILEMVSAKGNVEMISFVIENYPKDNDFMSRLKSAYDVADKEEVKTLIASHMLFIATKQGNVDLAKLALKRGANIDAQDKYQETALHKACYLGHIDIVRLLLENNCRTDIKDKYSQIAYEMASGEIKNLLLNYNRLHSSIATSSFSTFSNKDNNDSSKPEEEKENVLKPQQ